MLFCSSQCFAVNANGDRTPAPKGTQLLAGQRLETAPGGYAQVRLGGNAAVGVGEQASVRFEPNAVILDQGRIRVIGGEAFGKAVTQPIELRTSDGTLVLRGADVEIKKSGAGPTPARTLVEDQCGECAPAQWSGRYRHPQGRRPGHQRRQSRCGRSHSHFRDRPAYAAQRYRAHHPDAGTYSHPADGDHEGTNHRSAADAATDRCAAADVVRRRKTSGTAGEERGNRRGRSPW